MDYLMIAAICLGWAVAGAGFWSIFAGGWRKPDEPEETQDDFRASAERWAYLRDQRKG